MNPRIGRSVCVERTECLSFHFDVETEHEAVENRDVWRISCKSESGDEGKREPGFTWLA